MVETPFLEIAVRGTVFDVTVSPTATEVTVEAGQVRIATPDGLRQIELEAGESAYAGGPTGAQLAFRRAQGEPVEPVEAIILPAMHPKPGLIEGRPLLAPLTLEAAAAHRASSSSTAASEAAVPIATAAATPIEFADPAAAGGDRPGSRKLDGVAVAAPAPLELPVPVEPEADRTRAAPTATGAASAPETRRELGAPTPASPDERLFDRLTEGMVDTVPAAPRLEQPPARCALDLTAAFAMRTALGGRAGSAPADRGHAACRIASAGWLVAVALCGGPDPAVAAPPDDVAAPSVEAGALDSSRAAAEGDWVVLQAAGRATWRPQGSVRWRRSRTLRCCPRAARSRPGRRAT